MTGSEEGLCKREASSEPLERPRHAAIAQQKGAPCDLRP